MTLFNKKIIFIAFIGAMMSSASASTNRIKSAINDFFRGYAMLAGVFFNDNNSKDDIKTAYDIFRLYAPIAIDSIKRFAGGDIRHDKAVRLTDHVLPGMKNIVYTIPSNTPWGRTSKLSEVIFEHDYQYPEMFVFTRFPYSYPQQNLAALKKNFAKTYALVSRSKNDNIIKFFNTVYAPLTIKWIKHINEKTNQNQSLNKIIDDIDNELPKNEIPRFKELQKKFIHDLFSKFWSMETEQLPAKPWYRQPRYYIPAAVGLSALGAAALYYRLYGNK